MVNVPWTVTKKSVASFFANFNLLNGEHGIHFIVDDVKNYNNAFVQLGSTKDVTFALQLKQLRIFKFLVKSMYQKYEIFFT